MNMNEKHSYSLMRPADFFQNFQRENFSAEFFPQNFFKTFSAEFFPQNFQRKNFFKNFSPDFFKNFSAEFFSPEFSAEKFFQRNIFSASLVQELNLSGYPFHLTKAFFFFWSRRITFSIRKIF